MTRLSTLKYLMLTFAGTTMLIGATLNVTVSPKAQAACGSNPNCPDGWSVSESECSSFPCTCGSNNIPYTCYREVGTCNATGLPVVFTHCFEGGCCCPSGNCAGGGGGGGGGGIGGGCSSDEECGFSYYCDEWGECQKYEQ